MRLFVILICCALLPLTGDAARMHGEHDTRTQCEQTKQKIRRIQAKMRQGYSAKQGEKMQQQLRELRARRAKICG